MMLDRLAPIPGTGWGCVVCNLPLNGAIAMLCDKCVGFQPLFICRGEVTSGERCPIDELPQEKFGHDESVPH